MKGFVIRHYHSDKENDYTRFGIVQVGEQLFIAMEGNTPYSETIKMPLTDDHANDLWEALQYWRLKGNFPEVVTSMGMANRKD